jgi:multiple sugar transport system substrate-binding protein
MTFRREGFKTVHPSTGGLSRRDFLRVSGFGMAGAVLLGAAGCGGQQGAEGEVEIFFNSSPDDTGTAKKLIERFNQKNRGRYRVTFRPGAADTGQRFDQLRTQLQAGGEDLDVILGDVIWTAQLAALGYLVDLSGRFTQDERSDFLSGSVEAITYENKLWGVPWFTDTGLLYYRKDLLEESGFDAPPKTWDELKQQAAKVKQDRNTKFGFVFQGANYEGGVCNALEQIWTHGGEVLDPEDSSRVLVDSPEAIAGLTTYRSMVESGAAPEAVTTYKEDESAGAFLNGDAVFLRNWPYVYSILGDPEGSAIEPGQVGVSELPSADGEPGNGTVGDQPLYISASSENPDAAWELIEFLTTPDSQQYRAVEGSFLPTRGKLYGNARIRDEVPVVPLAEQALQHTRPRPVSPYYSDISLVMAEQFNAVLKGNVSPEEAAGNLRRELEELIEKGREAGG